jgi:hypothetical protein
VALEIAIVNSCEFASYDMITKTLRDFKDTGKSPGDIAAFSHQHRRLGDSLSTLSDPVPSMGARMLHLQSTNNNTH